MCVRGASIFKSFLYQKDNFSQNICHALVHGNPFTSGLVMRGSALG